jgi:hypothetical protein
VYLTPEFDAELEQFAIKHDLDLTKAYRLLLQRGLAAPVIPEFALATLKAIAKSREQTLEMLLTEVLTRYAIEHADQGDRPTVKTHSPK